MLAIFVIILVSSAFGYLILLGIELLLLLPTTPLALRLLQKAVATEGSHSTTTAAGNAANKPNGAEIVMVDIYNLVDREHTFVANSEGMLTIIAQQLKRGAASIGIV